MLYPYYSQTTKQYYPFGSAIQSRAYSSGAYRYGFQGQEGDDEMSGESSSWNYKYRMHDARLGRFFAVDPLFKNFAYNSNYAFSENRLMDNIELEGLEAVNYNIAEADNVSISVSISVASTPAGAAPPAATTTITPNTINAAGINTPGPTGIPKTIGMPRIVATALASQTPAEQANFNARMAANPGATRAIGKDITIPNQFNNTGVVFTGGGGGGPVPGAPGPTVAGARGQIALAVTTGFAGTLANNTGRVLIITDGSAAGNLNAQAIVGTAAVPARPGVPAQPATGLQTE